MFHVFVSDQQKYWTKWCLMRSINAIVLSFLCLTPNSGFAMDKPKVLATVSHDFNGKYELFSYEARPSEELGQAEAIAKDAYGGLVAGIQSPSQMFMCTWRPTGSQKLEDDRPAEIFLVCNFAPAPVEMPKSLVEASEIFNVIDKFSLRAKWTDEDGTYSLSSLSVKLSADRKSYHSINRATKMHQVFVEEGAMVFPRNRSDRFRFSLELELPHRPHPDDEPGDPLVRAMVSGEAEPTPKWKLY